MEAAEAELKRVGQSFRASTADVAAAQARVTGAEAALTNSRAQAERVLPPLAFAGIVGVLSRVAALVMLAFNLTLAMRVLSTIAIVLVSRSAAARRTRPVPRACSRR